MVSSLDPQVLIAAADDDLRAGLRDLLASHPLEVTASRPLDFLTRLACSSVRVLILVLTAEAGLELLDAARERRPDVPVLVLRAQPTVAEATEAMRRGAEDFLPIPYVAEALRKEVARILEAVEMRDSLEALHHLVADTFGFDRILSRSACMRPVFERAVAASRNDTPVLVVGETGTGKELIARAIHANSRRANRPFVPVNCAALPRDLFESELFGHRRGAFSGAHADYPGLFVSAHGGTLFLDEVGELPAEAQPKLLRVLQDGEVRPVGGLESRKVNTRIIAASNRTLGAMNHGAMRQDLFFRLSVLVIEIPPLRARPEDLPLLVQATVERLRARGIAVEAVEAPAIDLLAQHSFPGNIRELENLHRRSRGYPHGQPHDDRRGRRARVDAPQRLAGNETRPDGNGRAPDSPRGTRSVGDRGSDAPNARQQAPGGAVARHLARHAVPQARGGRTPPGTARFPDTPAKRLRLRVLAPACPIL